MGDNVRFAPFGLLQAQELDIIGGDRGFSVLWFHVMYRDIFFVTSLIFKQIFK